MKLEWNVHEARVEMSMKLEWNVHEARVEISV